MDSLYEFDDDVEGLLEVIEDLANLPMPSTSRDDLLQGERERTSHLVAEMIEKLLKPVDEKAKQAYLQVIMREIEDSRENQDGKQSGDPERNTPPKY